VFQAKKAQLRVERARKRIERNTRQGVWLAVMLGLLLALNALTMATLSYHLMDRTSDLVSANAKLEVCREAVSAP